MKKVFISLVVLILLFIGFVLSPYIYNHYLFSLARLKNSISIGDDYSLISKKFENYQEKNTGNGELYVVIEKRKLFIYHVNIFDDCQLTVEFDLNGKVKNVFYIGD